MGPFVMPTATGLVCAVPAMESCEAFDALPCPVTVHLVDSDGVTCQYANRAARQRLPAFIMTGSAATADEHRAIPVDRGDDGALAPLRAAAAAVADGPALDWPDLLDRDTGTHLTALAGAEVMWFNASVDVLADGRRLVVWTDVATAVGAVVSLTIAWEETAAVSALLETSIEAL